ncbi:hypothetical protein F511_32034 [Dorcoceras hygrometricum]|uniref:Uncharacterized protein n=1 Tax=Dorcoceras hygrometricum TaxID=472368 RepID=A0A2Z7CXE6_9LAMI|nr:hypothetical protein F511_32034 [Dorcoceras hygrometricum]
MKRSHRIRGTTDQIRRLSGKDEIGKPWLLKRVTASGLIRTLMRVFPTAHRAARNKKHSKILKEKNKCLKDKSDDPSCSQLDDSDSPNTELSKPNMENESLRTKSNELTSENDRLNQLMSSWTKSSVSLGKLHDVLKPFNDKTGLGFRTGERSSGDICTQSDLNTSNLNQKGKQGIGYSQPENSKSIWFKNRLEKDRVRSSPQSPDLNQLRQGLKKKTSSTLNENQLGAEPETHRELTSPRLQHPPRIYSTVNELVLIKARKEEYHLQLQIPSRVNNATGRSNEHHALYHFALPPPTIFGLINGNSDRYCPDHEPTRSRTHRSVLTYTDYMPTTDHELMAAYDLRDYALPAQIRLCTPTSSEHSAQLMLRVATPPACTKIDQIALASQSILYTTQLGGTQINSHPTCQIRMLYSVYDTQSCSLSSEITVHKPGTTREAQHNPYLSAGTRSDHGQITGISFMVDFDRVYPYIIPTLSQFQTRVSMTFRVVRNNQYNQDLGFFHSTNGNHLESPNEGSLIVHQVTIHPHAQKITIFLTNETWYFTSQMLVSSSSGLILILTAQSTRNVFRIHSGCRLLIRSTSGFSIPSSVCTRKYDEDFTDGISSSIQNNSDGGGGASTVGGDGKDAAAA